MRFSPLIGTLASLLTIHTFVTLSEAKSHLFLQHSNAHQPTLVEGNVQPHLLSDTTPATFTDMISKVGIRYYNLTWLQGQVDSAQSTLIPKTSPRITTVINLDKPVYRPNDVVFIEVLLLNTITKTPIVPAAADQ